MWKVNHVFAHRATTPGGRVARPDDGVVTVGRSRCRAEPVVSSAQSTQHRQERFKQSPVDARIVGGRERDVTAGEIVDLSNS
jgi:hypothetical protein